MEQLMAQITTLSEELALVKAEIVSGPLSLIILAIVFGTLLAALLPVGVGILTVLSAMGVIVHDCHKMRNLRSKPRPNILHDFYSTNNHQIKTFNERF